LLVIYNILDSSPQNAVLSATEQAAGGASNTTAEIVLKGKASVDQSHRVFSELTDTTRRIGKSCFEFFGELERFNLLYAKAPKGEPANMFYGGAFTKQEVLSQYKYMPDLAFTTASYVKLNSYPIPPRKNMLSYYTDQIGTLLNLAESQVNSIQIPAGKEDAVSAPLKAIRAKFADARTQYLALYKLVEAASDQNLADIHADQATYGPPVMNIDHDMNDLQVAVNDLMTIVTAK